MVRFSDEDLNDIYDKNRGHCWHCRKRLAFSNYVGFTDDPHARGAWEVDHSVPLARGGTDYFRNLVPACVQCNRSKGDLTSREFSG
jgi:5-methylcytosine-specific restriction endonuclease McrA